MTKERKYIPKKQKSKHRKKRAYFFEEKRREFFNVFSWLLFSREQGPLRINELHQKMRQYHKQNPQTDITSQFIIDAICGLNMRLNNKLARNVRLWVLFMVLSLAS